MVCFYFDIAVPLKSLYVRETNTKRWTKSKVKCTLVQALRLCTGRTAHRRSRGIALLFLDHGTRRGRGVRITPWPLYTPQKDPVRIVQEAGWATGPVWTCAENLAPTGIRSRTVQPIASRYTDYATKGWTAQGLKISSKRI
jgi:hypothetical protein